MKSIDHQYKIREIFYSIQGEGFWTGTACIFIRFFGCNLNCAFCDENRHKNFSLLTSMQVLTKLQSFPAKRIVLTGGEPLIQIKKMPEIIFQLKNAGYYLHLETNGTIPLPCDFDWITVSPKTADFISGDELKLIFADQNLSEYEKYDFSHFFLQPKNYKNKINRNELTKVVNIIKENPDWQLSVQLHKFLKIK